jgi:hypothetical protein
MAKGGEFEREISKFLTKWLTGKQKPYKYWRQDASGGLATVHAENVHMSGDIKPLAKDAEFLTDIFSIECKTGYPKTSFWQHFTPTKFALEEFWSQAIEDARDKYPMLIYRKLRRKPVIGINNITRNLFDSLIDSLNYVNVTWRQPIKCIRCNKVHDLEEIFLYDFNGFFDIVKPDHIKNLNKKRIDYGSFELDS